mmetsp:Transcript_38298/g.89974  ORF Transcript_38298/g.89974 Transcript_38298/m.89974 type:complete len:210 (+) Transcript_38298:1266-1895(+)
MSWPSADSSTCEGTVTEHGATCRAATAVANVALACDGVNSNGALVAISSSLSFTQRQASAHSSKESMLLTAYSQASPRKPCASETIASMSFFSARVSSSSCTGFKSMSFHLRFAGSKQLQSLCQRRSRPSLVTTLEGTIQGTPALERCLARKSFISCFLREKPRLSPSKQSTFVSTMVYSTFCACTMSMISSSTSDSPQFSITASESTK